MMGKYKITFKKSVVKDFRNIPQQDVQRILKRIDLLAENPRAEGCIKLTGQESYRVRQGLYRIVYEVRDDVLVINVVKVGHRFAIYKNN
jgi:mRNA interferase RelE/StbE